MLREVPIDMVKRILYLLNTEDLQAECRSNKYVSSICQDDEFFHEYISRNFDPSKFGTQKWDNSIFQNNYINNDGTINTWKSLLGRIISKREIKFRWKYQVFLEPQRVPIFIYFYDTIEDIVERLESVLNELNINLNIMEIEFEFFPHMQSFVLDYPYLKNLPNPTIYYAGYSNAIGISKFDNLIIYNNLTSISIKNKYSTTGMY